MSVATDKSHRGRHQTQSSNIHEWHTSAARKRGYNKSSETSRHEGRHHTCTAAAHNKADKRAPDTRADTRAADTRAASKHKGRSNNMRSIHKEY